MKKYISPDFDIIQIKLTADVLSASQIEPVTEETIPGTEVEPTDPFDF